MGKDLSHLVTLLEEENEEEKEEQQVRGGVKFQGALNSTKKRNISWNAFKADESSLLASCCQANVEDEPE